jgi:signal transduction histidine kinase
LNPFPVMLVFYPIFAISCLALSIDVLQHQEASARSMGDLARKRSSPWLIGTSAVLLGSVLLVTLFITLIIYSAYRQVSFVRTSTFFSMIAIFDFVIESSIGLAVILLGQAIVAYEVFTGKTLPRRGFLRHWRNAILLAAGLAGFISFSLMMDSPVILSLLMMAVLTMTFYALLSWRSFVHRDYMIAQLRPFVDSPALMQQLISADDEAVSRAEAMFTTICRDVLNTERACLIPLGVLAPLAGGPISYPAGSVNGAPQLASGLFPKSDVLIMALDPANFDGYHWAIPLWAERGLIGAMLLGGKPDGSLYAQEEIDIARASAERIVDMRAGEQMARRLVILQRQRHTQTRVVDLKTRRTLHDDVLPALHTAVLQVNAIAAEHPALKDTIRTLTDAHQQISNLIHTTLDEPRALPISKNLASAVRQMVDAEFAEVFQSVTWQLADDLPTLDDLSQDVLLHAIREAIRNAAIHGRGRDAKRALCLTVIGGCDNWLTFQVIDNGIGIAEGPRGGERSGGLALHSTMLAIVGGYLLSEAGADGGTSVTISLPFEQ